ncbi:MAG: DUF1059 domain-containing protein [Actinomycetota bacterium]
MADERVQVDCRATPNVAGCTLQIIGREDEVIDAAAMHAVAVHGHEDGAELREMIRSQLQPA